MAESFIVNERQFKFEMVAPEKVEVSAKEERVTLPGEKGDFMVLAGHTQLLAGLRAGVVTVHHTHSDVRYFITGGFADIGNQHCTVLTPHIVPVSKLVIERLERDLEHRQEDLAAAKDAGDIARIKEELTVIESKLDAARKYNV